MGFVQGQKKCGGRAVGVPNKISASFKGAVALAFQAIGGNQAFAEWAASNPTEFYKIACRLVPPENKNSEAKVINVRVNR